MGSSRSNQILGAWPLQRSSAMHSSCNGRDD